MEFNVKKLVDAVKPLLETGVEHWKLESWGLFPTEVMFSFGTPFIWIDSAVELPLFDTLSPFALNARFLFDLRFGSNEVAWQCFNILIIILFCL